MVSRPGLPKIVSANVPEVEAHAVPVIHITRTAPRAMPQAPRAETRPCFASSWIDSVSGREGVPVTCYEVSGVDVSIHSPADASIGMYAIDPPEYHLSPAHLQVLSEAISQISRILPTDVELNSLGMARPYIKAKARDFLYSKLAAKADDGTPTEQLEKEAERLAEMLCKYTAGYGVLETLLEDGIVQDIYVDAPSGQTPVQAVLRSDAMPGVRQKCRTNIFIGRRDLQGLVSRIKFETGLPFSEAHPVLEADMRRLGARFTLVGPPLSDKGVSIAIRKHSESVWTMPRLIANGSLSPLLSSFLWACVLGRRTVLIAGSRGAGKTTLLGSMLLEFPLSQRILLIEDTPEIPARRLQDLGYDLQALRFYSENGSKATSAHDALRVSLRMGESAIVIGEVRGEEAKVLYESMRAGSAGSAVLGTIHGNSVEGVLDRAVEDLGVSERAFSSTDIVVVIGLIRSPDGTRFERRVVEVAEVREHGDSVDLVQLFGIRPGCSCAMPTGSFSPESKAIRGIAGALGVSPEQVMDIVKTRAHADQVMSEAVGNGKAGRASDDDSSRVRSNEVLTKSLFGPDGPESGLQSWRAWYASQTGA